MPDPTSDLFPAYAAAETPQGRASAHRDQVENELISRLVVDSAQFSVVAEYVDFCCFSDPTAELAFHVMEEINKHGRRINRSTVREGMLAGWIEEGAVRRYLRRMGPWRSNPARVLELAKLVRGFAFNRHVKIIARSIDMVAEVDDRGRMLSEFARLQEQFAKLAELTPQGSMEDFGGAPGLYSRPSGCALYRWFDRDGRLLYVGITGKLHVRQDSHSLRSTWSEFASDCQVVRYPTKELALAAETAAIKDERPLFNKMHNDTTQARQALVDYLVSKGRTDLLAASLSRG